MKVRLVRKITELPVLTKICCVPPNPDFAEFGQNTQTFRQNPTYPDMVKKRGKQNTANVTVRLILLD